MRGCGGGLAPNFSGRDDPNFLRQIVSAHRRSQDFSDGGCAKGWIQDFWLGDDGGAKGPDRGAVGPKRRSAEGVESGEGRRIPSPVWGSGGIAPKNF